MYYFYDMLNQIQPEKLGKSLPLRLNLAIFALMLKRWLHIVLAAWLINALICFHPALSNIGEQSCEAASGQLVHTDNTLIDVFFNHFVSHKGNSGHSHKKSHAKIRYIVTRSSVLNILLLAAVVTAFCNLWRMIRRPMPDIWENLFLLPFHHHFLFRLSPF